MARTMQHFVDHFEETPVVVLPCLVRYRDPTPTEGASIYPACQNLLLAARALGYGGVMTTWHQLVEDELRAAARHPRRRGHRRHDPARPAGRATTGRCAAARSASSSTTTAGTAPAPWAVDPDGTRFTSAGPPR